MYLRETKRRNRDGSVVSYLALAHNERDPESGTPRARILYNLGRADRVDRAALGRLVDSVGRFLDPEASRAGEVEAAGVPPVVDARPMGTSWVADQLWQRLGIATALGEAVAGGRVNAAAVERVIFAMVANRLSAEPLSKRAGTRWVAERVFIDGLEAMSDDDCYRAMDRFGDVVGEVQRRVFFSVANLLNLEVDLLFFDSTSTYWETETGDAPADGDDLAGLADDEDGDGDVAAEAVEAAVRTWGRSKDHRPDLPQVVIGMAVTREGIPVRLWTFPGDTSDQKLIRRVKDDLRDWQLGRVIWVLDRGFTSEQNRRYLQRAGGGYIMGEKLRGASSEAAAALGRQGRYRTVAGNLRVKEVRVDDGAGRDRFVVCHNPEAAERDAAVRAAIVARLEDAIADSDGLSARKRAELAGALKTKPGYNRFLRTTPNGYLRVDRAAVRRDAHYDGKYLLRTSDESLTAGDIAEGYKALYEAERGWRDLKTGIDLRPVFHHKPQRIEAHVQLCWLALLLIRVAEHATGDTWRNLRAELDRLHLVTMATNDGHLAQRGELTPGQRDILTALELPTPPRIFDFTPADSAP
ncbi:IS1634 family transposase [Egibacter rhizosphaerae]|uniref:IS1634 family transposase n=1 Tax=Egibacter rhizosphaerae TaxID=1670831 RepID=A0A411YEG7_9ACTN|nr:IS1634 family transposase [Egibacter rhizosphaerae]QBI19615.1 IS1634 family transposase [Egibacter rhizosphaerae]